jgi:hypothetical protein
MSSHRKFTAITSAVILSLTLLTVTTESAKAASYQVSTLSGQGGAGEFSNPRGISVAPSGEVFVADTDNFAVKKIATNGVISVFAQTKVRDDGFTDESFCSVFAKNSEEIWASNCNNTKLFRYLRGNLVKEITVSLPFPSTSKYFDWGGGLVVDNLGGIFLSDEHNHVILRVDEVTGKTSVYAGKPGITGNSDIGLGLLNLPRGLALDSKNNLFIADQSNGLIRKITPEGRITSIPSNLPNLIGVAVDSFDSVYATSESWNGSMITKIGYGRIFDESSQKFDTKLMGGIIGQPAFNNVSGLSIDSRSASPTNNIYITDGVNHAIKVYSSAGKFIKKFGSEDGYGITAPGSSNQIYMHPNHTFPQFDGSYLVLDNYTIRHVSESGNVLKVTRLERHCSYTGGATFNFVDGTFFCASGNYIEVRFTDGTWTRIGNTAAGRTDGNAATARFNRPEGFAVFKGELYVADMGNGQIRKIKQISGTRDFQVTTFLGTGIWAGGGDVMVRTKANFASPTKLTIDGQGNLYIADGGVDSVYRTSVVQDTDVTRVGRGIGSWPSSLVADGKGIVYVSGWGGKIYQIENNKMTYLAGNGIGNKIGSTESARFNRPTGMSIDRKGALVIADRDNQQIKVIELNTSPNYPFVQPSQYSTYKASTLPVEKGLTAADDQEITEEIVSTYETGLISRIYEGAKNTGVSSVPNRDSVGLALCNVSHVGMVELELDSRPIFEGSGCGNKRFLIKYSGFITWPGSGKQTRTIYASSLGGVFVQISGEPPLEKWSEPGGAKTWPYDKSSILTLQGGKQYPIEVWYFRNQLNAQDSASLNLYWSALPSSKASTSAISEKYFSPAKSESNDLVEAPVSPSKPIVSINLNFINLKVRVPVNASSVILFAPELGVAKAKPIVGKMKSGFASFEVAVSSKFAGKKGTLQLVSENAVGESEPLKIPVTVPKVATKSTSAVKKLPKPQTAPNQPKVNCKKGAQTRPFEGSCPPGWTNG